MYLGIDVGGTKLLCRAVDANGDVIAQRRSATGPEVRPAELDTAIDTFVDEIVSRAGVKPIDALSAVGVAVPGLVARHGQGEYVAVSDVLPHLAGWRPRVLDRVGVGCLLNDVRAALRGVLVEQPQQGDVAVVVVGTGIATAFASAGRVHTGADGWAGELGSMPLMLSSSADGTVATLDDLASGAAVLRTLRMPPEEVSARALEGDAEVQSVLMAAGRALGAGLASLVCLVNPRRVVLAGGTLAYPGYLDAALETAARLTLPEPWRACTIQVDPDPSTLVVRGATHAGRLAEAPS